MKDSTLWGLAGCGGALALAALLVLVVLALIEMVSKPPVERRLTDKMALQTTEKAIKQHYKSMKPTDIKIAWRYTDDPCVVRVKGMFTTPDDGPWYFTCCLYKYNLGWVAFDVADDLTFLYRELTGK